jgi:hypothetical protein
VAEIPVGHGPLHADRQIGRRPAARLDLPQGPGAHRLRWWIRRRIPRRQTDFEAMNTFLDAVGETPISQTLQTVAWLIPLIQSVHILALALVFTSAAVVDLRILGVAGGGQPLERMIARFLPWVGWGVLALAATGLLLMIAEPKRALLNPYFQIKMAALLLVGSITWAIAALVAGKTPHWDAVRRFGADKPIAIVSLALWVGIVVLGRWIAYGP